MVTKQKHCLEMKGLFVIISAIATTIVLCANFSEARGIHHRRKYENSSESESNEVGRLGDFQRERGEQNVQRRHHGTEATDGHSKFRGRGFWEDLGSLAKKAAVAVYDKAKQVDWKGVANKVKNVGAAAFNEAKKSDRKK